MNNLVLISNILLISLLLYTLYKRFYLREGAKGCDASSGENRLRKEIDTTIANLNVKIDLANSNMGLFSKVVDGQRNRIEEISAKAEERINDAKNK